MPEVRADTRWLVAQAAAGAARGPGSDVVSHGGEVRVHVRMSTPSSLTLMSQTRLAWLSAGWPTACSTSCRTGREDADASGIVVGVLGPAVHNGGLLLSLGIESFGFNPPMVEMRIRIFVEELEPLAVPVELTAALNLVTDEIRATWRSSAERLEGLTPRPRHHRESLTAPAADGTSDPAADGTVRSRRRARVGDSRRDLLCAHDV